METSETKELVLRLEPIPAKALGVRKNLRSLETAIRAMALEWHERHGESPAELVFIMREPRD